jgi:hypothetical protein
MRRRPRTATHPIVNEISRRDDDAGVVLRVVIQPKLVAEGGSESSGRRFR